jgi:ATP-dependent DNA helicase RecQ
MREYAEVALKEMAAALSLVMHYFKESKQDFLKLYFAGKDEVLKLATSEASWQSIVYALNTTQKIVVADPDDRNRLILAGPGSGKTRVIVHRIAYLLRVRRMPASSIIALTFNRHAANEIRRRLFDLVGNEAYGLTILTYHAMAMRLTGVSYSRLEKIDDGELDALLERAAELLEGKHLAEGEDDLRERLLRGYRYILVDEYQDIDERQYNLVSALAKRHSENDDDLCILAVGDDDQNIYQWRGGSNQHIERYQQEYKADISYLVENFRSSKMIIATANLLIEKNRDRLKAKHPIQINNTRQELPMGGHWQTLDHLRQGRVSCIRLPAADSATGNIQAQAVLAELQRLRDLEQRDDWQGCAVLARTHRYLLPIQAWCEHNSLPYYLAADKQSALPLTRQRGYIQAIEHLRANQAPLLDANSANTSLQSLSLDEQWTEFFHTAFEQLKGEFGECQLARATLINWLYDYTREMRQQPRAGLYLGTVHSAKGLEFRHVALLDGGWNQKQQQLEDERRLYYVGMTRAEETLTLCEFASSNAFTQSLGGALLQQSFNGQHDPALDTQYQVFSMKDIDIGYPGRQPATAVIHQAIQELKPGDSLRLHAEGERYLLQDLQGRTVGSTSKAFRLNLEVETCEVAGIITRYAEDSEDEYRIRCKAERWEIVIPRVSGRSTT